VRRGIGEARAAFTAGGHGAYPVVRDGTLVGILTRGDVLRDDAADDDRVVDHASTDVVTVGPGDGANDVLHVMLDEHVEHVPVVADGAIVGICTRTDLLKVRRGQRDLERTQRGASPMPRRALVRLRRGAPAPGEPRLR
jgi:CBS domain-containing protein